MNHLSLFLGVLFCFQIHADNSCQPNYVVARKACKSTDQVEGYTNVTVANVVVNTGACDPDDTDQLRNCEAYSRDSVIAANPGARPQDVRVKKPHTKIAIGKFCKNFSAQVRVIYCDFEFPAPVYKKVVDESCPVENVSDTNSCFSGTVAKINSVTVDSCLNIRPENEVDLWVKAACLSDVYKAQSEFRLQPDLSRATLDRVEVQLQILQSRTGTPAKLIELMQAKTSQKQ